MRCNHRLSVVTELTAILVFERHCMGCAEKGSTAATDCKRLMLFYLLDCYFCVRTNLLLEACFDIAVLAAKIPRYSGEMELALDRKPANCCRLKYPLRLAKRILVHTLDKIYKTVHRVPLLQPFSAAHVIRTSTKFRLACFEDIYRFSSNRYIMI